MGLFGTLDVASAAELGLVAGTYNAIITTAKVSPTAKGDKTGLSIIYTISTGNKKGETTLEWFQIPTPEQLAAPGDDGIRATKAVSRLKARLLSVGIPESRINTLESDDLIDLEVVITLKPRRDDATQFNVTNVRSGSFEDSSTYETATNVNPFI